MKGVVLKTDPSGRLIYESSARALKPSENPTVGVTSPLSEFVRDQKMGNRIKRWENLLYNRLVGRIIDNFIINFKNSDKAAGDPAGCFLKRHLGKKLRGVGMTGC